MIPEDGGEGEDRNEEGDEEHGPAPRTATPLGRRLAYASQPPTRTVGTSDFDAQMSGIKFWKDDENLRPVYKKPFDEILRGCLHLGLFKNVHLTVKKEHPFFENLRVENGRNNSIFRKNGLK